MGSAKDKIDEIDDEIDGDEIDAGVDEVDAAVDKIDAVVNDAVTNVNKVTGILSGALGALPFKIGIFIVAVYQLLYISYKAFLETRTDNVVQDDCYCAQRDRIVYRIMTFTLMGAWILFLPTYGFYKTVNHFICTKRICCRADNSHKYRHKIKKLYEKYNTQIEQCREYFLKEMMDMITPYYLDTEHYKSKEKKLKDAGANRAESLRQESRDDEEEIDDGGRDEYDAKGIKEWCSCTKNCCFMLSKIMLISMRFGFRLVIIPLLQLHWLNDYAWNCIFNDLLREYCATITNEYFIGLDHSLIIYAMYVFILSAILFSIIIDWFPRGIPNFILEFEGNFNSLKINVTNKKRQLQSS